MGRACRTHGKNEITQTKFGSENVEKRQLGRPKRRWKVILEWISGKYGEAWTGFIWLRIWTSGGLL
jgi:hypothetical protein